MEESIRRIGVLTGGGDCPGLNAVIRAVVKTAANEYGWEVLGIEDGFEGLILPGKLRRLGPAEVRGILPRGGTILGTTNRANPFAYEIEENGRRAVVDVSDRVVARLDEHEIDALVVIGGDGSLRIARELIPKGVKIIGVPKTIDNDIRGTDVSFGFDTAVNTAMEALDRLHTTAESHHRVIVIEVMGRDAGWIALEAGIAGGADVILIPEIAYRLEEVVRKIDQRKRKAKFSLVVVAEGARRLTEEGRPGDPIYLPEREIGGTPRLGGVGEVLARQVRQACQLEVRLMVLGHLLRGGSPTAFDRVLASRFGAMAVRLIAEGRFGSMVSLQGGRILATPIEAAAAGQKLVSLDNDRLLTALGLDVSLGAPSQAIAEAFRETPST